MNNRFDPFATPIDGEPLAPKYFLSDRLYNAILTRGEFKSPAVRQKHGDHLLTQIAVFRLYREAMRSPNPVAKLSESFEPGCVADFRAMLVGAEFYERQRDLGDPPSMHHPTGGMFDDE